jgi:hypothetical protein
MEVLEWLEGSAFEWDMYVDLPEKSLRYCFRTAADASALKRQFDHAGGKASCCRRQLTGDRTKWCCPTASATAAGTKPFTNSA